MIHLIGHGYIGSAIFAELSKGTAHFAHHHHENAPKGLKGEVIINAAGYTGHPNVDACETTKARTILGNVLFPAQLEANNPDATIVHVGSGCIYMGGPFTETDAPNFTETGSFYSLTKATAETVVDLSKNYMLRVRMPFGPVPSDRNLLTKLLGYRKLVNHLNSITSVDLIAKVAVWFALNRPEAGIYNVVNTDAIHTDLIAYLLSQKFARTWDWFEPDEFRSAVVAPRSVCSLSNAKLLKLYPHVPHVTAAVEQAVREYA